MFRNLTFNKKIKLFQNVFMRIWILIILEESWFWLVSVSQLVKTRLVRWSFNHQVVQVGFLQVPTLVSSHTKTTGKQLCQWELFLFVEV